MHRPLVVQKFGGSSVADADRIRRVARRIARERGAGSDLVVVVSAMGDTTDELLTLAHAITDEPDLRELDMLLATGGPHAPLPPARPSGRSLIATVGPRPIRAELQRGNLVIVAGFQGQSAAATN